MRTLYSLGRSLAVCGLKSPVGLLIWCAHRALPCSEMSDGIIRDQAGEHVNKNPSSLCRSVHQIKAKIVPLRPNSLYSDTLINNYICRHY